MIHFITTKYIFLPRYYTQETFMPTMDVFCSKGTNRTGTVIHFPTKNIFVAVFYFIPGLFFIVFDFGYFPFNY